MCFLPPMCVFCRHYNRATGEDGPDCSAFAEIPDAIFSGDFDHRHPYPGDKGVRFAIEPEYADDYVEVMRMRERLAREAR